MITGGTTARQSEHQKSSQQPLGGYLVTMKMHEQAVQDCTQQEITVDAPSVVFCVVHSDITLARLM